MIPRKKVFEQIKVDEWITGEIEEIQYEQDHEFTYKGNKTKGDAVRVSLRLDGYKDKKSTGWMRFNYGEKSNLYKIFIEPLVEGARTNMTFDFDNLKDLRVKVMFTQKGEYQNLSMIRPLQTKVLPGVTPNTTAIPETSGEEVPF